MKYCQSTRIAFLLMALLLSGCANWRRAGLTDDDPWGHQWRPRANSSQSFGIDNRARAIEKNLGIY